MEDKRRFWPFLLVIPLVIASIVGWLVLPDELVMQIGVDGRPSNIMPKLFGLLIPPAVGLLGAGIASSMEREKKIGGFLVLAVAVIVTIITFMWNL